MARTVLADLRAEVVKRARGRCEYCQLPEDTGWAVHEVDHVIARKHGGQTEFDNLAYACPACNRYKGTDIASIDPRTGKVTRLFNPRTQKWDNHFRLNVDGTISSRTAVGRTTVQLLHFNDFLRVQIRAELITVGRLDVKHR